jgi:hypothetical protein
MDSLQQLDERLEASVGIADGEEWKLHTSPLLRCVQGRCPYGPRYDRSCRF